MKRMMNNKEIFGYASRICENPGELKTIMHAIMVCIENDVEGFDFRMNLSQNENAANAFPELFGLFGEAYRRACVAGYCDYPNWVEEMDNEQEEYPAHYLLPSYKTVYEEFVYLLADKGYKKEANEMITWMYNVYANNFRMNLELIDKEPHYRDLYPVIRRIESAVKADIPAKNGDEKRGMYAACYLLLKTAYSYKA